VGRNEDLNVAGESHFLAAREERGEVGQEGILSGDWEKT